MNSPKPSSIFASSSPTAIATSRRFRPTLAAIWRWAGRPTTSNCARPRSRLLPSVTAGRGASAPATGRPKCTSRPSRCRGSLPRRWRGQRSGDWARADDSARRLLVRDVEVELDEHVVRIGQENLPARAVRHFVHPKLHSLVREMLLDGLEAAAAEGDVVDDTRIRPLRLVGGRDVVEMKHGMAFAVQPCAGEVEWRSRPIHQTQHILVEANGIAQVAGRDVVVIEHTDAHAHLTSPSGLRSASFVR